MVVQFWGLLALLHLYPSGRPLGRVHAVAVKGFTWALAVMGLLALGTDPLPSTGRSNPLAIAPAVTNPVFDAGVAVLPVFALLGVGVLIRRWGAADPVERAQLKWFFAGAALVLMLVAAISFIPETTPPRMWEGLLVVAGFWGLPAAILVAITRYRLYEIDRFVSRTVSYVLLTALLLSLYAGTVVALQQLLRPVTGESQLAVAGATLLVAALFQPARRRIQTTVDRRFNRSRYDAQRTVDAFRARLRDDVDLDEVVAALASTTHQTVEPAKVSLWLRTKPAEQGRGFSPSVG